MPSQLSIIIHRHRLESAPVSARELSRKETFSRGAHEKGVARGRYANAAGRMRSSLKVGSNDSTNAPEPRVHTWQYFSSVNWQENAFSKIAIGQIVAAKRRKPAARTYISPMTSSTFYFRETRPKREIYLGAVLYSPINRPDVSGFLGGWNYLGGRIRFLFSVNGHLHY